MQIWEVLIYLISSCRLIVCNSAPFTLVNKSICSQCLEIISQIHGNNIPLLKFLCKRVLETLETYGRNRPAQSLNISEIAGTSIKPDTLNHVVVKGKSKYCRYQQCGRRTTFKCEKCIVSLYPKCMKTINKGQYGLCMLFYVFVNHCDKLNIYTLHVKHIFNCPCFCEISNF